EQALEDSPELFTNAAKKTEIDELATICYTSGTTGNPKGVMLAHRQIISEVVDVFDIMTVNENDRSLTFLPFAHILARVEHFGSLYSGFCAAYAENIDRIRSNLLDVKPTFFAGVPRIFEKIYNGVITQAEVSPTKAKIFRWSVKIGKKVSQAKLQKKTLPPQTLIKYQIAKKLVFDKLAEKLGGRMRFAISGGAPLSREIAEFFHAANLLILEGYGLTETTAAVTLNSPYDYCFGTVGKPLGDVEIKIAEDGEILVKSDKVMMGYYNRNDANTEVFQDGYFCTGDIGEITPTGFLRITDRKKDLIKTAGGKYVAPQKLENLLKISKYISNVLIHGDNRKYIVALVTIEVGEVEKFARENGVTTKNKSELVGNATVQRLIREEIARVNSQLASYESIKNFAILENDFTIESGELTPSLKVKRKFCDKKFSEILDSLYHN
ncbi:MAG: long-chain fatty acid--CoA ligase, partial [Bdellovibrionales bacterium]|nr:long-chain fatty acid--CoA ligase [Bdellovibrionales bacterium]